MKIGQSIKDNFYLWVNQKWLDDHPIPPDQTRWGSLEEISEEIERELEEIIFDSISKEHPMGSELQLIGDYYLSAMDIQSIEEKDLTPLSEILDQIDRIQNRDQFFQVIIQMQKMGANAIFKLSAGPDPDKSIQWIPHFHHRGLGLINREYYLAQDQTNVQMEYLDLLRSIFQILNLPPESAEIVFEIEKKIAIHSHPESQRDPRLLNKKYRLKWLEKRYGNIPWVAYFKTLGIDVPTEVVIDCLPHFECLNELLQSTHFDQWKLFLKWHLLRNLSSVLGREIELPVEQLYCKVLRGQSQLKSRHKRVISLINQDLGMVLGKVFIERNFTEEDKKEIFALCQNIKGSFRKKIEDVGWLQQESRMEALKKIDNLRIKVGYPDQWPDTSSLLIGRESFAKNFFRIHEFHFLRDIGKIGKMKNFHEWEMTPQRANAYYNPWDNEIVIPAGILRPPFFESGGNEASNYGGIGMVIGHELSHAFDNEGRHFDAEGNLKDWWGPEDSAELAKRSASLIRQYSTYTIEGKNVDGMLTNSENIADLGGLTVAYEAFIGEEKKQFFISFAKIFRSHSTKKRAQHDLIADPRAPKEYRVNGPLSNFSPFYEVFGITETDRMFLPEEERSEFWEASALEMPKG